MLLKYTGPKPQKRIEYNSKIYLFTPTCEVNDAEAIKFLLHADRKELFVEEDAKSETVSIPKKEIPIKKRGRRKKKE